MSNKILILDARSLSGLAFVRSLGLAGNEIHVGESFKQNLSRYSRFANKSVVYPNPEDNKEKFHTFIKSLAEREKYDVILPMRDITTVLLSEIQKELSDSTNTLLANPSKIKTLSDKWECEKLANRIDVSTPNTYHVSKQPIDEITEVAQYPVLIKPREESGARGIVRADTPSELKSSYSEFASQEKKPIIQEFVNHSGGHYSIGTVFDENSNPRAVHVYEELIQYPDTGGPAIQAKSVEISPWVHDVLEILSEIEWVGPAHMDVLFDPADEKYKLLEVNPRIWSSINLSIQSGVNIPRIITQIATSATPPELQTYDSEMYYRWTLPNELLWVWNRNNKVKALKQLRTNSAADSCHGVLSHRDPTAILGVVAQSLHFVLDKEKRQSVLGRSHDE
ncbi:ATP-grasp domain-containing protein [Halogranum amylolyticum]|uniref:ATP-grasp domain-containing protein n=1 Tax=Halogranum amylolyticum TaxID=660520 RepID=A0A1H8WQN7_9EURY|nr:ATP-grasp domain-containing protein [Halogranum amylolyticum]SEP29727.1 ATP-grasp domain-containing protein [Halogranum amylolyticum]